MSDQKVSKNVKVLSVSIITAAALVAGGIAYASGDAFTACVNKKTGLTRIISGKMKCYKSERLVTWNQTGPTGAQGSTGLQGTSGFSTTYVKSLTISTDTVSDQDLDSLVLSIPNVPAGNYLLSLSMVLDKYTGFPVEIASVTNSYVDCSVTSASTWGAKSSANAIYPEGSAGVIRQVFLPKSDIDAGHNETIAGTAVVTLQNTTTVNLLCNYAPDNDAFTLDGVVFRNPSLTLTRINEVVRP